MKNVGFAILLLFLNSAAAGAGTAVLHPATIQLPTGQHVYKITLNSDGIYELSYDALQAAGMPVDIVNPQTIAMMHRGEPVAYAFVGNENTLFEPGEAIRFYGWAFDGSRYEQQFVTDNVFWLWTGGTPARIESLPNTATPTGSLKTTATATVTVAPENDFFSTWTDRWSDFPNEPDAWYWDRIPRTGIGSPAAPLTYTMPLPTPDESSGDTAVYTAEFTSRAKARFPGQVNYAVSLSLNGTAPVQQSWLGRQNVNISGTIAAQHLQHGDNVVTAVITTTDVLYLNRISITYPRQLVAENNQLIFTDDSSGRTLQVSGFSENSAENFLVWQLGEQKRPLTIPIQPEHLTGSDTIFVKFGSEHPPQTRFIITTTQNMRQPHIQKLMSTPIDPPDGKAQWLAIAHPDLLDAAQKLADYRESISGFSTHVVNITDIFHQYGYGLPLPEAIRQYLIHAHATWETAPDYVLLFGDATINPRQLNCRWSCSGSGWDETESTMIPTDLLFVDRYQGLIPSDHTPTLLHGNDLLADVALGRIPARSLSEANIIVDKIIEYEQNQAEPDQWHQAILFVADNADAAGDFCELNQLTGQRLPKTGQQHLCLPINSTADDLAALQAAMYHSLNVDGAWILNYRGHGSIQYWGGDGQVLLSIAAGNSSLGAWLNEKPTVILSADCLDGHFAWPGVPSISETLLRYPHGGTAAHWSSTGLGLDRENTILHNGFYDGIYTAGATRIGDAILYAKATYLQTSQHRSPIYSFTLQGDPAMLLTWAQHQATFLPMIFKP